jgi:hypothetical protein
MEIVTLVAMHLGRRFTHAVISAPQEQIEHGFVHRNYQSVNWSGHEGVAVSSLAVPEVIILAARKSDLGSVRQIRSYLRVPGPLDHALACTHAALNRLTADDLPANLSGKALFLDEAHHASADGLSQIISVWRQRGGQLFFFTATPYRGDGRPVALEGMRLFRRSLAEHMAEGFAPGHLDSEIVALGKVGDLLTPAQVTGEDAPPPSYFDDIVNGICGRWLEDGKPKTIVRVPPTPGGSGRLVGRLIHALSSQGARVLDATGIGSTDKQRFLCALQSEKNKAFSDSEVDLIVGIQRVFEGLDWPLCSAVYCVGLPGSLNTVVQLLGRAMRRKAPDYPAAHRERAKLLFFVPCAGGSALADLSIDHSRHTLLTCCFLADHQVGQEWIVLRAIRRGIEDALGRPEENASAADAENEANEAIDPEVRAQVELAMASAREQIISDGGEPTLGEVVQWAAKNRPDLPKEAVNRVATEILASQPGSTGQVVREAIRKEVAKRLRIDPMVKRTMEEAFTVVLNEFRAITLEGSPVLESVGRQVHGVTGGQMQDFAARLREAAPRPLTEEQILTWADLHHRRTGAWPGSNSGSIHEAPTEKWANINVALRNGHRGLPGKSSLAMLLEEERGVRNPRNLSPLTKNEILAWADSHRRKTREWPRQDSGPILDAPDETWRGIDHALRLGMRNLPSGSSLAQLLAEERGTRNQRTLPLFTTNQILAWADSYHERTSRWPTAKSGSIPDAPGETWNAVQIALQKGLRGLSGGSTLVQLLAEERGVRNRMGLPDLTEVQILAWADAHHDRTGQWPKEETGQIFDAPGETWKAVQVALVKGERGLPGGSSLARLLARDRGVRNHLNTPLLSVQQILDWADAHLDRTGQWPKPNSGSIHELPGETWAGVNHALRRGSRGLPGGSSLARLLADERQVRNAADGRTPPQRKRSAAPPVLTEQQILVWADAHHDRTGQWPGQGSGPIRDAPGETWTGINHALNRGSRGLRINSSLAMLLERERNVRNIQNLPNLTKDQILAWADDHFGRTGTWPKASSGPIHIALGETWSGVNAALYRGLRGLPGGFSLARLLQTERGVPNKKNRSKLTHDLILAWADAHYERTGRWPNVKCQFRSRCHRGV